MQFFLDFLDKVGRKRIISDRIDEDVYMERYYVMFPQKFSFHKFKKFNLLLHHICRSDNPEYHDHPWDWSALILKGGYWENTPQGRFWRGRWSFRSRKATELHWLELDKEKAGGETWTLFWTWKREREWGFLTPQGWVQWEEREKQLKAERENS